MRRALLLLLVSLPSLAAESRWGLRWRAPDDCISAAELASRVETKLGRSVFGINPDYRVDGLLEAQAGTPKWKARITVVGANGDVLGSREVTGNDACRALDEKLAFVVAVSIDPNVGAMEPVPTPAPPVAVAPAPVAPAPVRRTSGGVYVEIESDDPDATLFRHVGTSWGSAGANSVVITTIEKACEAPCNDTIEKTKSDYFISGRGITLSPTFSLSNFDAVKLKVKTGSSTVRWLGWTLTILSASTLIVGVTFWALSAIGSSQQMPGVQNPYGSAGNTFRDVGIGLTIGGAAALAAGIPMIAFSGTKVELFPLPSVPAPLPSNISEI